MSNRSRMSSALARARPTLHNRLTTRAYACNSAPSPSPVGVSSCIMEWSLPLECLDQLDQLAAFVTRGFQELFAHRRLHRFFEGLCLSGRQHHGFHAGLIQLLDLGRVDAFMRDQGRLYGL